MTKGMRVLMLTGGLMITGIATAYAQSAPRSSSSLIVPTISTITTMPTATPASPSTASRTDAPRPLSNSSDHLTPAHRHDRSDKALKHKHIHHGDGIRKPKHAHRGHHDN